MWKPSTIVLHWTSAIFIIGAIFTKKISGSMFGVAKITMLQAHIIFAIAVISLLPFRVYFKRKNRKTNPKSNKLATFVHHSLYTVVFLLGLSGLIIGFGGVFSFAFLNAPFPRQFVANYPIFDVHSLFGNILIGLVLAHIAGALFHLFQKGNHSFSRMIGINKQDKIL